MVPPVAVQLTVMLVVPVTVALNCAVPPGLRMAPEGVTLTEIAGVTSTVRLSVTPWKLAVIVALPAGLPAGTL